MKTFISDLWADLREKRLWPVAVVLLAGLVAVPVVLTKSSEAPPTPAEPVASGSPTAPEPRDLKGLATVKLEESDDGSSLNTFDPGDPFRPPEKVVEESRDDSGQLGGPGSSGIIVGGDIDSPATGGDFGSPSAGGGETAPPTTGGGEPGGGDGGSGDDPPTKTTEYTYVIDVKFINNGRTRKVKGMERLDMLPNAASPLLLFLGVSQDAGNAVFLVDSTLEAAGEGSCRPSPSECAFLHLGAGSEHEFTGEDGDSYTLAIDEIRKVKVDSLSSAGTSKRGKSAKVAAGASARSRRFVAPLIADLVSVSNSTVGDSDTDQDRR